MRHKSFRHDLVDQRKQRLEIVVDVEQADRLAVNAELRPGPLLEKFLECAGAEADPVLPYVYASEVDDARVVAVIAEMAAGQIDAIAFTSAPQVRRLRDVARAFGREAELRQGLERVVVAAIGPVVAAELEALGVHVNVTPRDKTFFMKPLVRELAAAFD